MASKSDNENESGTSGTAATAEPAKRLQLGLRLKSDSHSDQPVFSNFTMVQGAPGVVFLDFGFLEPAALPAIARLAQSGGKPPGSIDGRLACRVVLGMDVAAQLAEQLDHHLRRVAPHPAAAPRPPRATN